MQLMVCILLYWISHQNVMKLYHINIFCGLFLPWHNKNFLLFHKHLQNSEEIKKMLGFRWIDTMFKRCNNILDLERIWKEVTLDLGLKLVTLHRLFGFRSSIIHKMWFFYLYNVVHFFFLVWFAFMYSAVLKILWLRRFASFCHCILYYQLILVHEHHLQNPNGHEIIIQRICYKTTTAINFHWNSLIENRYFERKKAITEFIHYIVVE